MEEEIFSGRGREVRGLKVERRGRQRYRTSIVKNDNRLPHMCLAHQPAPGSADPAPAAQTLSL